MTTHRVYKSASVDYRLKAQKRKPHGRQVGAHRVWKLRDVEIIRPDGPLAGVERVGRDRLKTVPVR